MMNVLWRNTIFLDECAFYKRNIYCLYSSVYSIHGKLMNFVKNIGKICTFNENCVRLPIWSVRNTSFWITQISWCLHDLVRMYFSRSWNMTLEKINDYCLKRSEMVVHLSYSNNSRPTKREYSDLNKFLMFKKRHIALTWKSFDSYHSLSFITPNSTQHLWMRYIESSFI